MRVTGEVASSARLPPYSIEDPVPTADGCTISSVVAPAWALSNFEVDVDEETLPEDAATAPFVGFYMRLRTQQLALDYPVFVHQADVDLRAGDDEDAWVVCEFGQGEVPLAPKRCEFRYRADWICIDLDEENPFVVSCFLAEAVAGDEVGCVIA